MKKVGKKSRGMDRKHKKNKEELQTRADEREKATDNAIQRKLEREREREREKELSRDKK